MDEHGSASSPAGRPRSDPPVRAVRVPVDPASVRQEWLFFLLAVFVLCASLLLRVEPDRGVVLPLVRRSLPMSCAFRWITGHDCPGCGMTRSFISLAHGDWAAAWKYNPAGPLWFGLILAQVPYRAWQIRRLQTGRMPVRAPVWNWVMGGAVGILLLQWIGRGVERLVGW